MSANLRLSLTLVSLSVLVPLGTGVPAAAAATKTVSPTQDLRVAILNADPGDTIVLMPGVHQALEPILIAVDLTIQGDPSGSAVINGFGDDILHVSAKNVRLENLTLRNGRTAVRMLSSGTLVISGVTVTGNTVRGIHTGDDGGHTIIVNSTIAGNRSPEGLAAPARGIESACSSFTLRHVTVADNDRGVVLGLCSDDTITIQNTLIVGNEVDDVKQDCRTIGNNALLGHTSFDSDGTCRTAPVPSASAIFTTVPNLGLSQLADNGGTTPTMALAAASPAIDAGSSCTEPLDQRGAIRNAACDIGAYERASAVAMASPTGAGTVNIVTTGIFLDFLPVPESAMPNQSGKPIGVTFPYGFFRWSIGVSSVGGTAVVDTIFPAAIPAPAQYWKVINGVWTDVCVQLSCTVSGNRLTMIFEDGGFGDLDGIANAVIFDPGGLGSSDVDFTPPEITIAAPADGDVYLLNAAVPAAYECFDAESGIAACSGPVASGASVLTNSVGAQLFPVEASDGAGNTAAASARYTVSFGTCVFYDPTHAKKSGSSYVIKLQLCDANGRNVSSPSIVLHAANITPATAADPNVDVQYDESFAGYAIRVKTEGLPAGNYSVNFIAGADPVLHSASFAIR